MIYTAVLILLIRRLKRYFPSFYKKESTKIYIASISVIVSIVFRIGINVMYSIDSLNSALDISYADDTWLFPITQLITMLFASLFPIASVIYSLMYAISHKKRMIKRPRKHSQINKVVNASGRCHSIHSLL